MANGNLVQPATGTCPNGCRAPQYDNEKCTKLDDWWKGLQKLPMDW